MKNMTESILKSTLRPALSFLIFFTILTGIVYPLVVTGVAQVLFPKQANGSLIYREAKEGRPGQAVGSALIGQEFKTPGYFWGRLSATGTAPYNALASGGTNYGALNPALAEAARGRVNDLREADSGAGIGSHGPVPMDLATASASGLDPDISLEAAEYQAARVAHARGWPVSRVHGLIAQEAQGKFLGFSGIPRVNVLRLNLALDALR